MHNNIKKASSYFEKIYFYPYSHCNDNIPNNKKELFIQKFLTYCSHVWHQNPVICKTSEFSDGEELRNSLCKSNGS